LSRLKKEGGELKAPTLNQFFEKINELFPTDIPVNSLHKPFVAGSWKNIETQQFVVVWTTSHLVSLASSISVVQLDATYKILYFGLPVMVIY
jgi:hypothetical protein